MNLKAPIINKAFDNVNRGLLSAKRKAYGFSTSALKLLHSYLKNGKQTSSSEVVIAGVGIP